MANNDASGLVTPSSQVPLEFTGKELRFGHAVYIIMMVMMLLAIGGFVWAIVDFILPQGLLSVFLSENLGLKIVVIGIAAFVTFFLLILFYSFGKKGTRMITKAIFSARRIYAGINVSKLAQFTTWGLIISLGIFVLGLVWYLVGVVSSVASGGAGSSDALVGFFIGAGNGGLKFLALTLFGLGFVLLFIFVAWLVSDGNIFFARIFLKIPVNMPSLSSEADVSSDEFPDAGSDEFPDAGNDAPEE
jgi:hypothetical protein